MRDILIAVELGLRLHEIFNLITSEFTKIANEAWEEAKAEIQEEKNRNGNH